MHLQFGFWYNPGNTGYKAGIHTGLEPQKITLDHAHTFTYPFTTRSNLVWTVYFNQYNSRHIFGTHKKRPETPEKTHENNVKLQTDGNVRLGSNRSLGVIQQGYHAVISFIVFLAASTCKV